MVTITDYRQSTNSEGQNYFSLKLQGEVEMIQSASGSFYATAKTAFISSTFDELACKALLGSNIPGSIDKELCDPYDYTIESTGEVIQLAHRYKYRPEGPKPEPKPNRARSNGISLDALKTH